MPRVQAAGGGDVRDSLDMGFAVTTPFGDCYRLALSPQQLLNDLRLKPGGNKS